MRGCGHKENFWHGESDTCGELTYGNKIYYCASCLGKRVEELEALVKWHKDGNEALTMGLASMVERIKKLEQDLEIAKNDNR